jgi:NMD protein affecting ribosome stability and mRNA decay
MKQAINKNPQYFEGVLQIRNAPQEVYDFIADEIGKKGDVWIAKTRKQKNGDDLYVSSNKFLAEIAKKLDERFPGQMTKSKTLHTQDSLTSKDVFRGTVLFRYCGVKKGDILNIKGDKIQVIAIGKEILGKNLETNQKVHVKFDKVC